MIALSPLTEGDLPRVAAWLQLSHVARWWLADTTAEAEIGRYRQRVAADSNPATTMLLVSLHDEPVGWCQWYSWADYPAEAVAIGACEGEAGIDYALGDPARIGHGTGTMLVAALVAEVGRHHPGAGIVAGPDADNVASRRVLEKNGFHLVAERSVATEPSERPIAIYRLPSLPTRADGPQLERPGRNAGLEVMKS